MRVRADRPRGDPGGVRAGSAHAGPGALARREQDRQRLRYALAEANRTNARSLQPDALRGTLRGFLTNWTHLLGGNLPEARNLLGIALDGRIGFTAESDGYRLTVPIAFDRVMVAALPDLRGLQEGLASPPGFEPGFWP